MPDASQVATMLHVRFELAPYSHVSASGAHAVPAGGGCAGHAVEPPLSVEESPPEPLSVPPSLAGTNVDPPHATTRAQATVSRVRMRDGIASRLPTPFTAKNKHQPSGVAPVCARGGLPSLTPAAGHEERERSGEP